MDWRYGGQVVFPKKLALIHLTVSEKKSITDDGRPLDDNSSAVR